MFHAFQKCLFQIEAHLTSRVTPNLNFYVTKDFLIFFYMNYLVNLKPLMPQSFRPVSTVKLLGIMFINKCWSTVFHTVTARDADGWCNKWPV